MFFPPSVVFGVCHLFPPFAIMVHYVLHTRYEFNGASKHLTREVHLLADMLIDKAVVNRILSDGIRRWLCFHPRIRIRFVHNTEISHEIFARKAALPFLRVQTGAKNKMLKTGLEVIILTHFEDRLWLRDCRMFQMFNNVVGTLVCSLMPSNHKHFCHHMICLN